MENFRTEVPLPEYPFKTDLSSGLCFLGSCFSEHMEKRMKRSGFQTATNPNGIIFHPLPLAAALMSAIDNQSNIELVNRNEEWLSLEHHGNYRSSSPDELRSEILSTRENFHNSLKSASLLFITFGTAYGFVHRESHRPVANCHKLPASEFDKRLFSIEEMKVEWRAALASLKKINPNIHLIFTLSPVRYWKEGAHGNQLSKARLLLLIDELIAEHDFCHYFPAYEIVLDELRDYRFYADDMLHVSELAADFVFSRLNTTLLEQSDRELAEEIRRKSRILDHRAKDMESHFDQLQKAEHSIKEKLERNGYPERSANFKLQ